MKCCWLEDGGWCHRWEICFIREFCRFFPHTCQSRADGTVYSEAPGWVCVGVEHVGYQHHLLCWQNRSLACIRGIPRFSGAAVSNAASRVHLSLGNGVGHFDLSSIRSQMSLIITWQSRAGLAGGVNVRQTRSPPVRPQTGAFCTGSNKNKTIRYTVVVQTAYSFLNPLEYTAAVLLPGLLKG